MNSRLSAALAALVVASLAGCSAGSGRGTPLTGVTSAGVVAPAAAMGRDFMPPGQTNEADIPGNGGW